MSEIMNVIFSIIQEQRCSLNFCVMYCRDYGDCFILLSDSTVISERFIKEYLTKWF